MDILLINYIIIIITFAVHIPSGQKFGTNYLLRMNPIPLPHMTADKKEHVHSHVQCLGLTCRLRLLYYCVNVLMLLLLLDL